MESEDSALFFFLQLYRASWYYQSLFHFHQRMHCIFA